MGTFKQLISALHEGSELKDNTPLLKINEQRQIVLVNTNSIIAYEGDINSQIIVIDCPKIAEGHNLQNCQFKRIKWSNTSSGFEGKSTLHSVSENIDETTNRMFLQWEVEPEVFVKAGNIQITISFYDLDEQGRVAFQWNTASFAGLSVGAIDANVGFFEPAENEVLTINEETKTITAPLGYNNIIGNYGDIGVSTVYFRTKRKIRGIDLLGDGKVVLRINLNGKIYVETENLEVKPYSAQVDDYEGLVYITWSVPKEITNNDQLYSGSFSIEIGFETQDKSKVWRTSTYNQLAIGNSLFKNGQENIQNPDIHYTIDGNKEGGIDTTVPGTYLLKKLNTDTATLRDAELGVSYDAEGNYAGLKLGLSSQNSEIELLPVELNTVKYSEQELTDKEKQQARTNIGAGTSTFSGSYLDLINAPTEMPPSQHEHKAADITSGVLDSNLIPTISVSKGGTGATTAEEARANLGITPGNIGAIASIQLGTNNGVATLDANGHVPSTQLPSYVDDVVEGYINEDNTKFYEDTAKTKEITSETGKIYLDLTSLRTYRWGGTKFAEISESLALGETSTTAYRGDNGKAAYEHSIKTSGNPHGVTASDLGLKTETWTFTLEDGTPVTKKVYVV